MNILYHFEDFVFHNEMAVNDFFSDKPNLKEEQKKLIIFSHLNNELNRNVLNQLLPIKKDSKTETTIWLHNLLDKYADYLRPNTIYATRYSEEILQVCNRFLGILFKRGDLDIKCYNEMAKSKIFLECYSALDKEVKKVSHYGFTAGSRLNVEKPAAVVMELYRNLIQNGMISPQTNKDDFKRIFEYKLSEIQINWIKPKDQLSYFIYKLKEESYICDSNP